MELPGEWRLANTALALMTRAVFFRVGTVLAACAPPKNQYTPQLACLLQVAGDAWCVTAARSTLSSAMLTFSRHGYAYRGLASRYRGYVVHHPKLLLL